MRDFSKSLMIGNAKVDDRKKQILERIVEKLKTNKKLALVWIEQEFGSYAKFLEELNKIDPVEKALKYKDVYRLVDAALKSKLS